MSATAPYTSKDAMELSFKRGGTIILFYTFGELTHTQDILTVLNEYEDETKWYFAELKGKEGYVKQNLLIDVSIQLFICCS